MIVRLRESVVLFSNLRQRILPENSKLSIDFVSDNVPNYSLNISHCMVKLCRSGKAK